MLSIGKSGLQILEVNDSNCKFEPAGILEIFILQHLAILIGNGFYCLIL